MDDLKQQPPPSYDNTQRPVVIQMNPEQPGQTRQQFEFKHGLCGICSTLCCRGISWLSCCCPFLPLGLLAEKVGLGKGKTVLIVLFICYALIGHISEVLGNSQIAAAWEELEAELENRPTDGQLQAEAAQNEIWLRPVLSFLSICVFLVIFKLRIMVRERNNITGTVCNDLVCSFCCQACVVSQMSAEEEILM